VKVGFSVAARDDLIDITVYIAQDNPVRALSFVDELASPSVAAFASSGPPWGQVCLGSGPATDLRAKCMGLGRMPGLGTARPELGTGIHMFPHGRYLIFYREHEDMIRIERVMHGARDIGGDDFNVT
jgi:toxin ParE1/3/4